MTNLNPGNNQAYEDTLAKWMIEQITAFDAGNLDAEQIAMLDEMIPTWRDDDTRFHYGLIDDWTEAQMRAYLGSNQDSFEASDAVRIFCGRAPLHWND